jgi:hypothetical protein
MVSFDWSLLFVQNCNNLAFYHVATMMLLEQCSIFFCFVLKSEYFALSQQRAGIFLVYT